MRWTTDQVLERAVALGPSRIAAVFDQETLTYGALNAEANRLAKS
jgi:hypothetical protein